MRAYERLAFSDSVVVLDLPAGTGRHAEWLARLGHHVVVADVDPTLVEITTARLQAKGLSCEGVAHDAAAPLPFEDAAFDLALVVDFVSEPLLRQIGRVIRPGGFLIYESYGARGNNWRQLLAPGTTAAALQPGFDIKEYIVRAIGPSGREAETAKVLAQRVLKT